MKRGERREAGTDLHRRLWFLRERLKDVMDDPTLGATEREQNVRYYTAAIAEAQQRLVQLEDH